MRAVPTNRKRPLSRSEIANVCTTFTLSSHDDKLFLAILCASFHGLLQLGESVFPDKIKLHDYRKVILRSSVSLSNSNFSFLLPTHKADRLFKGNRVLITSCSTPDNPIPPFSSYIAARDTRFPYNPELWLRENGSVPTCRWFMTRLHNLFSDNVSGHSLRAGGTTALAVAGIPPHLIQAMGRWSSEAFKIYICQHPTLLAALVYSSAHSDPF